LPIDPNRTARLLGFKRSNLNSLDAVASRDLALRVVAEAAILGTTLSRLATDILAWCSKEFAFITLPDEVVGSSSAMPQKRNPFLLEHVQGLASSALGGFVNAASAMHSTPFTNSIAVGTEAIRGIWISVQGITDALLLCRLVLARVNPNARAMLNRAQNSEITSTALASRVAYETTCDFRSAHHLVGEFVRDNEAMGFSESAYLSSFLQARGIEVSLDRLDPSSVVADSRWGGGPAASCIELSIGKLTEDWQRLRNQMRSISSQWTHAQSVLQEEAKNIQQSVVSSEGAQQPSIS
jgi:argininosuccinate lyase